MKKRYAFIPIALFSFIFLSCSEKEVQVSAIDIASGGSTKRWHIEEFTSYGDNLISDPCWHDDEIVISKGILPQDTVSTDYGPKYYHIKNTPCGLSDVDDVRLLRFENNGKAIVLDHSDLWFVETLTDSVFILIQDDRKLTLTYTKPTVPVGPANE